MEENCCLTIVLHDPKEIKIDFTFVLSFTPKEYTLEEILSIVAERIKDYLDEYVVIDIYRGVPKDWSQ